MLAPESTARVHCIDCGHPLDKGVAAAECPKCGQWPLCHLCLIAHVEEGHHAVATLEDCKDGC